MENWFYFHIGITDSAIGQYVSLIPRMHDLCFLFFSCGCVAGFFLIECRRMEWYEPKRLLLTAWWPGDAICKWVDTSRLSFVQVRLVVVYVSKMDACLIRNKTSTHWPPGNVVVFSNMPFQTRWRGWNVKQFLSNYPNLNANGPHWNTNIPMTFQK